jgi:hypothetical protein
MMCQIYQHGYKHRIITGTAQAGALLFAVTKLESNMKGKEPRPLIQRAYNRLSSTSAGSS